MQADRAITETAAWLEAHPDDDFIRVTNLLFMVKRRGSQQQIDLALQRELGWLDLHPTDELVRLAVSYTERVLRS